MTALHRLGAEFSQSCSLRPCPCAAIGSFMTKYYNDTWPEKKVVYSALNAGVVSAGGALSSYLGGLASDRWSRRDSRARALVPAIGSLLAIPFMVSLRQGCCL